MNEAVDSQPDRPAYALTGWAGSLNKNMWFSAALVAVAFVGSAHLLIRSSGYGLMISLDSMHFLSTAENLAAGEGLRNYSFEPYVRWPPLYPGVLALLNLFGIDVFNGSRILNIVLFGLIVLITGHWLSRYIRSRLLVVGVAVMIVISYAINWVASFAWYETMFIFLSLISLIQLSAFLNQEKPMRAFTLSVLFASLATLNRYLGVAITVTAVVLILAEKRLPVRRKLTLSAIYSTVSVMPTAAALVYSRISVGYYTGRSSLITDLPLPDTLREIGDAMYVWFYGLEPGQLTLESASWVTIYLCLIAGVIILSLLVCMYPCTRGKQKALVSFRKPKVGEEYTRSSIFLPFVVYILVFIVVLCLVIPSDVVLDSAYGTHRYLSLIYIPVLISAAFLLERFLDAEFRSRTNLLKYALILLLIFGGAVHISRVVRWNVATTAKALELPNRSHAYEYMRNGYGYTPSSPIMKYLRSNPLDGEIYTNEVIAIFFATDILAPVKRVPRSIELPGHPFHLNFYTDPLRETARDDIEYCPGWVEYIAESATPDNKKYIVYLTSDEINNYGICPLGLISQSEHLRLVVEKPEGVIYRVS